MEKWSDEIFNRLEAKRPEIPKNDFRFLSISRITLLAEKTEQFSASCPGCHENRKTIEEMIDSLPECLNAPASRKAYDKKKSRVESHLRKAHRIYPAHYFYALFTLTGLLGGIIAGALLGLLTPKKWDVNLLLVCSAIGLLGGQIIGKRIDKKNYEKKLQI